MAHILKKRKEGRVTVILEPQDIVNALSKEAGFPIQPKDAFNILRHYPLRMAEALLRGGRTRIANEALSIIEEEQGVRRTR